MSKIIVENVSYVYSAKTPFEAVALNDVSVSIAKNRITGIIGHTGSGKSTLVQMFNGLIRPTSGKILLDGEDIWEKPKEIGIIHLTFSPPERTLTSFNASSPEKSILPSHPRIKVASCSFENCLSQSTKFKVQFSKYDLLSCGR